MLRAFGSVAAKYRWTGSHLVVVAGICISVDCEGRKTISMSSHSIITKKRTVDGVAAAALWAAPVLANSDLVVESTFSG